ncbi:MAG TPA: amidase domain-containing protein [Symbiobacteriaceae bacterium]|nr:amidase domain-containing protein [Symbiobacteriaceae bacterium]
MRRIFGALAGLALCFGLLVPGGSPTARAASDRPDLTGRLKEIFQNRAKWLLSDGAPPPLEADYAMNSVRAKWAVQHEQGKIRYVRTWAEHRRVRFVEATPSLYIKYLSGDETRARFYVGQTLALGYVYPGEPEINRFGVGSRHILELRQQDGRWQVGSEWYSDPLGDESEAPAALPALAPGDSDPVQRAALLGARRKGYDRQGAIAYADKYCGLAWGCGNDHRYNVKYRNYTGDGGDCTNFLSQILRDGGGLRIPPGIIRVSNMAGYLQGSGRGWLAARGSLPQVWKQAARDPRGFTALVGPADLVAYQFKGKMEHFAIITGFDSHGYPMVNSHTADRYHVPFDLGWDRRAIFWFFRVSS